MIISRTPFRISFVGGGTDIAAFFRHEPGAVISTTIDKYVYITVNPNKGLHPFRYRIAYSVTENVNTIEEIQHPIVRESLKFLAFDEPLEITNVADLPARAGLGSSSSFAVALLHALHALRGEYVTNEQLAREAHHIEVDILKRPIGKQDHYAAAYGGLNYIQFMPDDSVKVDPIVCNREVKEALSNNLMMFFTGITRDASSVLSDQVKNTEIKMETLKIMRGMTKSVMTILHGGGDLDDFGHILHEAWVSKKQLTGKISNDTIDSYYDAARKAGALGGKILGAGGGGFLLLYVNKEHQQRVRNAIRNLAELSFRFENEGSKIVYIG